jgi:hypothetical protein
MTTLGKTLVFLTFLAAIAMGGMMIYLSRTLPPYKEAIKDRDDYIVVLKAIAEQENQSRKKWQNESEKVKQQLDAALIEARAIQERLKAEVKEKETERKNFERSMEEATIALKQTKEEAVRLNSELNFTLSVVEARDKSILKLQDEVVSAKNAEQAAKNERDTAVARALAVLARLTETEIAWQKEKDKAKAGTGGVMAAYKVTDRNFENPPPNYVKGKVQEVDSVNKALVKISLGSDQGVNKDHTLLVYRLDPEPKYLGRILVTDNYFQYSYGKLVTPPGMPQATLMPGDEVVSKLRP